MSLACVTFTDTAQTYIAGWFAGPPTPPPENYGTVDLTDSRWGVFYASLASLDRNGLPAPV